jgi:hypothetical protein
MSYTSAAPGTADKQAASGNSGAIANTEPQANLAAAAVDQVDLPALATLELERMPALQDLEAEFPVA